MEDFTNRIFDEIEVGQSVRVSRVLSLTEVESLVMVSGDIDPFHIEAHAGKGAPAMVADAVGAEAMLSALINRRLPGPGTVILAQDLRFDGVVGVGDELLAEVEVLARDPATCQLTLGCSVRRGEDRLVQGSVTVRAPTERVHYSNLAPPHLSIRHNDAFAKL